MSSGKRPVTESNPPLLESCRPSEFRPAPLAPVWVRRSLLALRRRLGFKVFAVRAPRGGRQTSPRRLSWASILLQSLAGHRAAASAFTASAAPPLGFRPLQRLPARSSGQVQPGFASPGQANASRFSQPLDACTAPCLLALFRARSAPGVHPSEPCSSHAVVRCLQRRSPPDVGPARGASQPPRRGPTMSCDAATAAVSCETRRRIPRLQGLAPRENPPPTRRWFRPARARSSPGSSPLQGVLPRRNEPGLSPRLPSCGWPRGRKRPQRPRYRVLLPAR
jgi:hypothetical protein